MSKELFREIYEVWAGSEGVPEPVTCTEAYLLRLIEQMRDIAKKGMETIEEEQQVKHSLCIGPKTIQSRVYSGETGEVISSLKIPKPEWIGLTDDELTNIVANQAAYGPWDDFSFAHAIEAKLKEKNNGESHTV